MATITGTSGDDTLNGTSGDDTLVGGLGNDTLIGAGGNDTYIFTAGDGSDVITDFTSGDKVHVYSDGSVYLQYYSSSPDGLDVIAHFSSGDQITFQNTDFNTVTGTIDFFTGSPPILGTSGDDTLTGTSGYDVIAGGGGADTIDGGDGQDELYSGDLTPPWGFPYYGNPYTPPVLDHGTEVDTLVGGAGSDTLFAGYGDNVDGGSDFDTLLISFQGAPDGITFDMSLGTQTIGGATITGIESASWVEGSNFDDTINLQTDPGYDSVIFGMGGNDTLTAGKGTVLLDGGDGNDVIDGTWSEYLQEMDGGAGDDTIYGNGSPNVVINAGDGNDTIYSGCGESHGGAGNDIVQLGYGYYGADFNKAYGDAGDDQILGSPTDDTLIGGAGNDTLTGNGGSDHFQFFAGDGQDVVTDFTSDDSLAIYGYGEVQSITQVGSDVLLAFSDSDQITFQNTDVATVQAGMTFIATDDTIVGDSSDEVLNGWGGNDIISGGGGADTINGGDGNDQLFAGDPEPGPYSGGLIGQDGGTDHDVLSGGAGDDLLSAGFGDDVDGGDGTDTLRLNLVSATSGVTLDTSDFASGPVTIGGGTIQNIEQVEYLRGTELTDHLTIAEQSNSVTVDAGAGDDFITSQGGPPVIFGGDGNDQIDILAGNANVSGGEGNDTVTVEGGRVIAGGGDGDDLFYSGAGADEFFGDGGSDTVSYLFSSAGQFVDLGGGSNTQGDLLQDIENINGSNFADNLLGDYQSNALSGGDGNDTLKGGGGSDTLTGGAGDDTFLFNMFDGSDTITDFAAGDVVRVGGYSSAQSMTQVGSDVVIVFSGGDQITFENTSISVVQAGLQFDTDPPVSLVGTAGNDTLTGGSGDDTLNGAAGNDILNGKGGADSMTGGAGNDTFYVDNSGDKVVELARGGTDTVHSTISYTLGANVENGVLDGSAAINLTGNSVANLLTGNGGDNFLYGLGGNDTLKGGAGNDTLRGGLGADTLTGGLGADWFQFEKGGGNDKVTDFVSGTDKIDLHLLSGVTSADVHTAISRGNEVVSVDVNHDGRADFTITLVGVTQVNSGDFIFG